MKTIFALLLFGVFAGSLRAGTFADEYTVVGNVLQKVEAGLLVRAKISDSSLKNVNSEHRDDIALIVDYPNSGQMYDGRIVNCRTREVGTYQYKDVMGAQRTVQKLAFSSFPQGFDPDRH